MGFDEQTVDGVLKIIVTFKTTPADIDPDLQLRSLRCLAIEACIKFYFSSVLPLLTQYFESHFNPDKDYYLGKANIGRNQGSAATCGPEVSDDSDEEPDYYYDELSDEGTEAKVISKKCKCYFCRYDDYGSVFDAPEYWTETGEKALSPAEPLYFIPVFSSLFQL